MFKSYINCCLMILFLSGISLAIDFRTHRKWPKNMEEICGHNDRIIGGLNAALGQFPWIARLAFRSLKDNSTKSYCGGTLISEQFVLSATHCIRHKDYALDSVILGEHSVNTDPDCEDDFCAEPIQNIKILKLKYPKFNRKTNETDILVITLQQPAKLNGWVFPLCLPTGKEEFGTFGEIAGWGFTKPSFKYSDVLKFAKIPIVNITECRNEFRIPMKEKNQICAGSFTKDQDSCGGESGGPLSQMANSEHGPRHYLVGIISYGARMCGTAPAVYTSVSAYILFILDAMQN